MCAVINFEALIKFWDLIDLLKKDEPLTDILWLDFYSAHGNHLYAENNLSKEDIAAFRKSMEIVYRPSLQQKCEESLSNSDNWVIKVNRYKEHEREFKDFAQKLKDPSYLQLMYRQAFSRLPVSMQNEAADAVIYIMAIGADAAAYEKNVFLSLHTTYFFDKYNAGALGGHELHHVLRKEFEFKKEIKEEHKGVLYLLESVLNEGIADLIDKDIVIKHNDALPEELQWRSALLSHSGSILKKIDSLILNTTESNEREFATEEDFREIIMHSSGHIPGFYMARIISRNDYYEQMIENVSDPFQFIRIYNMAAEKDIETPPLFSAKSMDYISQLEKYYSN